MKMININDEFEKFIAKTREREEMSTELENFRTMFEQKRDDFLFKAYGPNTDIKQSETYQGCSEAYALTIYWISDTLAKIACDTEESFINYVRQLLIKLQTIRSDMERMWHDKNKFQMINSEHETVSMLKYMCGHDSADFINALLATLDININWIRLQFNLTK